MDMVPTWPVECADQLLLGSKESDVGICSLWTDRSKIGHQLREDEFAVIGNLYSRAGINPLLRNIFANPLIRYVVVTGRSLNDSFDALTHFFNQGVDMSGRIEGNGGRIDPVFPIDALEQIRHSVTLVDLRETPSFRDAYRNFLRTRVIRSAFAPPRYFPPTQYTENELPSEENGFVARGGSILHTWAQLVRLVMRFGTITPTDYGTSQRELLNVVSVIEEPASSLDNIPEWADFTASDVKSYVGHFLDDEMPQATSYSYGNRLRSHFGLDQVDAMARDLERSEISRRAIASLWDPAMDAQSQNPPCILAIQANIRASALHITCFVRSHDIFRAYPLNAAGVADLQRRLVGRLGRCETGRLVFVSQSAHIYSDCWSRAGAASYASGEQNRLEQDLRGSFVLRMNKSLFIADHFSAQGDLLQTLSATSSKELLRIIMPFISRIDHALYIGREVARLESAYKRHESYHQDRTD